MSILRHHNSDQMFNHILSQLRGVRKSGKKYAALCPTHDDRDPSLSLELTDNGTILLHCFAGCPIEDICAALGITPADLSPRRPKDDFGALGWGAEIGPKKKRAKQAKPSPPPTYTYYDTEGRVLFGVIRTKEKKFMQVRPDGNGGWVYGLNGIKPVPYRLPELIEAVQGGQVVHVAEGEKDADNLVALGLAATCNPMGAGKWRDEYSDYLRGASVAVLADNDEPGRKHAQQVAKSLHGKAVAVKVVEFPELPEKGDVSDWLEAGHTVSELLERVALALEWEPEPEPKLELDGELDGPDDWPEPEDITPTLAAVPALDHRIIPAPLRSWCVDVARRMNCPVDYVAAAAVVVAGALIGAGCAIRPKCHDNWKVVPNLWGGVVAPPSALKTPALSEAMKPMTRLEVQAKESYEMAKAVADAEAAAHQAQVDAIKRNMTQVARGKMTGAKTMDDLKIELAAATSEAPQSAARRRFKTNDATVEKLSELLNENQRGILIFRDELVGLLTTWDKPGRESDRAFFLEGWNGYGNFTTDRIGRGTTDTLNMCISLLGGIQPAKLTAYLNQATNALENDGLAQRLQVLVYPDKLPAALVDEEPNKAARDEAYYALETLAQDGSTLAAGAEPGDDRPFFTFTENAQMAFYEWWRSLEFKLAAESEQPVIVEHLAKYRSLMPSLALIDHLLNVVAGYREPGPVPVESVQVATRWCEYLEGHARRVYGLVGDMPLRAAAELAKKIKAGQVQDGFTAREVYRKCWHLLDQDNTEAACSELVAAGWLRKAEIKTGGRPAVVYNINPKIPQ